MKLFYSPASPYVRKVMTVAHETGLVQRIEKVTAHVSPVKRDAAVAAENPLGKVPTLLTDDGETLFDSRVICEYLDAQSTGAKVFPANGAARWRALRRQALADGMLDAAILTRYEASLREEGQRNQAWVDGQFAKIDAGLAMLEREAGEFGETADIGTLAIGCTLGYLDFRFAGRDWRAPAPRLAAWYEGFSRRPSLQETAPKA